MKYRNRRDATGSRKKMICCLQNVQGVFKVVIRILLAIDRAKTCKKCENLFCKGFRNMDSQWPEEDTNLMIHRLPPGGRPLERVFQIA